MGARVAGRLLAAGHEVVVWNRSAERVEPLVALGVLAAWGAIGVVVAARRFGWEPRER